MGKVFEKIEPQIEQFIQKQKMFFVSTAPLSADGLVNVSPKGWDSFRILDEKTVAYIDLTGSGIETVAHLKENQRITLLFCAFEGAPKLVRLQGKGTVLERGSSEYNNLQHHFPDYTSARAIIKIDLTRISDSCGYTVPLYDYVGERDTMAKWVDHKGENGIKKYWKEKNTSSLDGLPGIGS